LTTVWCHQILKFTLRMYLQRSEWSEELNRLIISISLEVGTIRNLIF